MIGRIIIGAIIATIGFFFVWKTDIPFRLIGYVNFAEKYFSGGSRYFYKLLGILFLFIGILFMTGLQKAFFYSLFDWIFP